MYKT